MSVSFSLQFSLMLYIAKFYASVGVYFSHLCRNSFVFFFKSLILIHVEFFFRLFNYDKFGEFYSLVFANGQRCYEQRSFLMKYLASSKTSLDAIITHEVYQLCDEVGDW